MHESVVVLFDRGSKPTVYRTMWVLGAVLILVSIPCFESSPAFYTLLSVGIACVLTGVILWSYAQRQENQQVEVVVAEPEQVQAGTTLAAQIPTLPTPELLQNAAMGQTLKSEGLPPNYIMEPTMQTTTIPAPVPDPPRKKKDKSKSKKKLRLSEKADVKEFDKSEAAIAVASAPATIIQTKDGRTLYVPNAAHMASYPNLEDIRLERERFNNRPETPDLDRHRRVGMMQEFARALPPERNGYMIPIISTQQAS